jgi:hypothetical protein
MLGYIHAAPTQIAKRPTPTGRFALRLATCVVLSALNIGVTAEFVGPLSSVTAHQPMRQAAVTCLFAALFGSLVRVWLVALRSRTR